MEKNKRRRRRRKRRRTRSVNLPLARWYFLRVTARGKEKRSSPSRWQTSRSGSHGHLTRIIVFQLKSNSNLACDCCGAAVPLLCPRVPHWSTLLKCFWHRLCGRVPAREYFHRRLPSPRDDDGGSRPLSGRSTRATASSAQKADFSRI